MGRADWFLKEEEAVCPIMHEVGPTGRGMIRSNRNVKTKRNRVVLAWHKEGLSRNNVIKSRISLDRLKSSNNFMGMVDFRLYNLWTDLICSKCLLKLSGRFSPKSKHPYSSDYHNSLLHQLGVHILLHLLYFPKPALLSGYEVVPWDPHHSLALS